MRRKLVILGTRVFAEEVADLVSQTPDHELTAFAENLERSRCDEELLGLPIIWVDDLEQLADTHSAVCAIGTTHRRMFIEQARELGVRFTTVRHPTANLSPTAALGPGTIVNAGVVVGARAAIGSHVIVNRGVLIGHHTTIGSYVTVSPGANIAGCVSIGEGTYVGMGAIVLDRISVGAHAVVGAGAVVTKDVPDEVQVQGVPARVVKTGIQGR